MGGKKYLIISLIGITLFTTGCSNIYKKGDMLYNDNFEIIKVIDGNQRIFEVRDSKTGIHYILNWMDDTFSPYYNKNKEVKQTQINEKYKENK